MKTSPDSGGYVKFTTKNIIVVITEERIQNIRTLGQPLFREKCNQIGRRRKKGSARTSLGPQISNHILRIHLIYITHYLIGRFLIKKLFFLMFSLTLSDTMGPNTKLII